MQRLGQITPKSFSLYAGPIFALALFLWMDTLGIERPISFTLCITSVTAIWWVSEALPIRQIWWQHWLDSTSCLRFQYF